MYLNEIYLGQRGSAAIHGMGEAALYYFGCNVEDLALPEAATLAGMIRAPNTYFPYRHEQACKDRRNAVLKRMLELGLTVGIGTDGPASNNDLDMFEETRLAAFLAKSASNDPTALPAQTALAMAIRMGAQALHVGHLTGTLEAGKRADLILVELGQLQNISISIFNCMASSFQLSNRQKQSHEFHA